MKKINIYIFILAFLLFSFGTSHSSNSDDAESIVRQGEAIIKKIFADPEYKGFQNNIKTARAVLIIPQLLKAGFFIGGSGGTGALISKDKKTGEWGYPAFYSFGAVSLGLQIGAESSEVVMLVMSDSGLNSLLSTSFKLGADATVAAGPVGAGGKAVTADILSYSKSKGLFGGVSVEGAVIKTKDEWNYAYYHLPVTPTEIIVHRSVSNPSADELRLTLEKFSTLPKQ